MPSQICPSREQLQAFYLGQLGDPPFESVATHLDECQACQSTVDQLADAPDTIGSELRRPAISDPFLSEAECDVAVQRFKAADRSQLPVAGKESGRTDDRPDAGVGAAQLAQVGQYQLLEKLGSGGMGTVYKAVHTKLKRVVALKVMAAERVGQAATVARFNREMEAVGRLRHPNIVEAYDAGEANGTHFLVMEFVDGIDLGTLVNRCGPLPIAEACELIRQAAVGLDHAHQHGLVH